MAKVNWIQGLVVGEVTTDQRVVIEVRNMVPMTTPRPRTIEESGADPAMLDRIRKRISGPINTLGFIGGAIAQLVPFSALSLLPEPLMAKLRMKYGAWEGDAYVVMVRQTAANAIWNTAEPSGGMAESDNLTLDQLCEGTELGIYRKDGWARFMLPTDLAEFQTEMDAEQAMWWETVRPGFTRQYEAPIRFLPIGNDLRNGQPGIMQVGPVGDVSFTRVARIDLTGTDWQLLDTESRPGNSAKGEPEWVALRRKMYVIVNRPARAPLMFELDNDGRLHSGGLHLVIDGENRGLVISHLSEIVLTTLGWFPSEEAR